MKIIITEKERDTILKLIEHYTKYDTLIWYQDIKDLEKSLECTVITEEPEGAEDEDLNRSTIRPS